MISETKKPLVSVIMPCYNVAAFIEKSIKSVFSQTYVNIELVCVNDGSTDNTSDVINKLKKKYNIKYIEQVNKGVLEARRTAIINSNGDYIVLVDADDSVEACAIEKSIKRINSCDAAVWEFYRTDDVCSVPAPLLVYDREEVIDGIEAFKQTLGGWKITGIGLFKKSVFMKAFALYDQRQSNSGKGNADEYITRAVFLQCHNVAKIKAKYFYHENINSETRLFKLSWLAMIDTDSAILDSVKKLGNYNELKLLLINQSVNTLIHLKNSYKKNYKGLTNGERKLYLGKCITGLKSFNFIDYTLWFFSPGRPIKNKIHFFYTMCFFSFSNLWLRISSLDKYK